MSSSRNPFGGGGGSGSIKRFGKALEKSNFAHTCNLLSQYVKERGTLIHLNLAGISAEPEAIAKPEEAKAARTTPNLLNNIEISCQLSSPQGKSVDPFSRFAPLVASCTSDDATRKTSSCKEDAPLEPKTKRAQMTIFYAGEVMVFDDFPAEKAKAIMLLASSGRSSNGNVCGSWKTPATNEERVCSVDAVASGSKAPANPVSTAAQESDQPPRPEANTSDLPIARRSSLHRFLAKRKDRSGVRGPYQLHHNNNNNNQPESSSKNDQEQLELKL